MLKSAEQRMLTSPSTGIATALEVRAMKAAPWEFVRTSGRYAPNGRRPVSGLTFTDALPRRVDVDVIPETGPSGIRFLTIISI